MLHKILPPQNNNFQRKLSVLEASLSKFYPSTIVLFPGQINVEQFNLALEKTLHSINFLFCQLKVVEDNVYAEYTSDNDKYAITAEFEYTEISLKDTDNDNLFLMPQIIDPRTTKMDNTVDGLAMLYLKLTQLADGFALAYYFNHAFLDQSSMVFFLKTLCNYYNQQLEHVETPQLVELTTLFNPADFWLYDNIHQFRQDARRLMNKIYAPDPSQLKLSMSYFAKCIPYKLVFKEEALQEFKATTKHYISTNDIVNAILMKINANDLALSTHATSEIGFACNLRKHFGLKDYHLGNLIGGILIDKIERTKVKDSAIIDVAVQIRSLIEQDDLSKHTNMLNWFQNLEQNSENYTNYVANFLIDPTSIISTNWNSFDYSQIKFNENTVIAIEQPSVAQYPYTAIIHFNKLDEAKTVVNITLPESAIAYAKYLAEQSQLFTLLEKA